MRILQVCTVADDTGTSGGVFQVCRTQSLALAEAGVETSLLSLKLPYAQLTKPRNVTTVTFRAHKVPGTGIKFLWSLRLLIWLAVNARKFDIVHIHLCRDVITMATALLSRSLSVPYVIQTHGMLTTERTGRTLALFDRALTNRIISSAKAHVALSRDDELAFMQRFGTRCKSVVVANAVARTEYKWTCDADSFILFAGRLHSRKRPADILNAILQSRNLGWPRVVFAGPDQGELLKLEEIAINGEMQNRVDFLGALPQDQILSLMAKCAFLILPSEREPYPMSILEAFEIGTPVIMTSDSGLAPAIKLRNAASLISPGDIQGIADAMAALIGNTSKLKEISQAGMQLYEEIASTESQAAKLFSMYESIIGN